MLLTRLFVAARSDRRRQKHLDRVGLASRVTCMKLL